MSNLLKTFVFVQANDFTGRVLVVERRATDWMVQGSKPGWGSKIFRIQPGHP
jgi:hypothetical protein